MNTYKKFDKLTDFKEEDEPIEEYQTSSILVLVYRKSWGKRTYFIDNSTGEFLMRDEYSYRENT